MTLGRKLFDFQTRKVDVFWRNLKPYEVVASFHYLDEPACEGLRDQL